MEKERKGFCHSLAKPVWGLWSENQHPSHGMHVCTSSTTTPHHTTTRSEFLPWVWLCMNQCIPNYSNQLENKETDNRRDALALSLSVCKSFQNLDTLMKLLTVIMWRARIYSAYYVADSLPTTFHLFWFIHSKNKLIMYTEDSIIPISDERPRHRRVH